MAIGRMKILAIALCLLPVAWGTETDNDCLIADIDLGKDSFRNKIIEDTFHGLIRTFETKNVESVAFGDEKYLKADLKNGVLEISTTEAFQMYEETEHQETIQEELTVVCNNKVKHTLDFLQPISFTNNHDPFFNASEYTFVLYHTLKSSVNLGDIAIIAATDYDISSTYFTLSIDGDDFYLSTYHHEGKTVTGHLSARRKLVPPFKGSYIITVKDEIIGQSRSGTAKVNVELRVPSEKIAFNESNYEGIIDGDVVTMKKPIALKNGIDDDLSLQIESDYKDYIRAKIDSERNEIMLIAEDLPIKGLGRSLKTIDLTLHASENGQNASVKVSLESKLEVEHICELGDIYDLKHAKYYRNPNTINDSYVGDVQVFEYSLNVLDVRCFKTKYLKCKFDPKTKQLRVFTTDEFQNYEETETSNSITIPMNIICPDYEVVIDYTQNINDVNNHAPEFQYKEYNYVFYNSIPKNFKLTQLKEIEAIDLDLDTYGLKMEIEENDDFKLTASSNEKVITGQLQALHDINSTMNDVTLTLTVKDQGDKQSTALVHISVLKNPEQLEFTKDKYEVYIENGTIHYVDNASIRLVNGFDEETKFNITNPYHSKYMKVVPNQLKNQLDLEIIGDLSELNERSVILTVLAEWRGFFTMSFVTVYLQGKPAHTEGIKSNLNGFIRWIMTSTIAQAMVCLVTLIALGSMIITLDRYARKKSKKTSNDPIDCKV